MFGLPASKDHSYLRSRGGAVGVDPTRYNDQSGQKTVIEVAWYLLPHHKGFKFIRVDPICALLVGYDPCV